MSVRALPPLWSFAALLILAGCGKGSEPPVEDLSTAIELPGGLKAFAVCGTSIGMAYYQEPKDEGSWEDDRLTGGRYVFATDQADKLHVLYRDSGGSWVDEAKDGAKVVEVQRYAEGRDVQAVVFYPGSGVMGTYSVNTLPDGGRWLLWTANKAHTSMGITKAGAYRARCA
jgi:hypothetical protein